MAKDSSGAGADWSVGIESVSTTSTAIKLESRLDFDGTVAPTDLDRATDAREKGRIGIFGSSLAYAGSSGRVTSEPIGRDLNPLGRGSGAALVGGAMNLGQLTPRLPGSKAAGGTGNSVNNCGQCGGSVPDGDTGKLVKQTSSSACKPKYLPSFAIPSSAKTACDVAHAKFLRAMSECQYWTASKQGGGQDYIFHPGMHTFNTSKPSNEKDLVCIEFKKLGANLWYSTMRDYCRTRCSYGLSEKHACSRNCASCCVSVAAYQVSMLSSCCNKGSSGTPPPPQPGNGPVREENCELIASFLTTSQEAARLRFPENPCIIDQPNEEDCAIMQTGSDSAWQAHKLKKLHDCWKCCKDNHFLDGYLDCMGMCDRQISDYEATAVACCDE